MSEKKSRIEIPPYIVRDEDRKKFVESFSGKLNACDLSYKSLRAMPDLEDIPTNLQEINAEIIEAFIDERQAEISSTKMLTSEKKKEAKEEWEKVKKDALSCIHSIKEFLGAYPDAEFCVSNGEVVCNNFDQVVTEHCKVKSPDGVTEWANLILGVKDAIVALQKFEGEHDLPTGNFYTIEQDLKMVVNPSSLVETWLFMEWRQDYIQKHPYLQGAYETSVRNGLKEQNDRLEEMRKKHLQEHPEDFIPLGNKKNPYENQRGSLDSRDYSIEMK